MLSIGKTMFNSKYRYASILALITTIGASIIIRAFVFQLKTIPMVFNPYFLSSSTSNESAILGNIKNRNASCTRAAKILKGVKALSTELVPTSKVREQPPAVTNVFIINIRLNLTNGNEYNI